MSSPYRDAGGRQGVEGAHDRGIVSDVIAQFADPHAFYRELVQNSIDAGSPEVHVDVAYDDSAQRLRVTVRDRGEGMTRDIIENQLLVLFRSTKEKERGKIGKFGVGFASVLAPSPEVVVVNTVRDGKRLTLHLYRDLAYELFEAGSATQAGTTVELEIAMAREAAREFEHKSQAALRRWCRHASVPITYSAAVGDNRFQVRIDGPLAFDKVHVQVTKTLDNGEQTIVAAITTEGGAYLGFFNHGLMLHETTTQVGGFPKVHVKVQDSRLGHTISRDDVRRDEHYRRAVAAARRVVADELAAAAEAHLRELASGKDLLAYDSALRAFVESGITLARWHFPLVDAIGDQRTIAHTELPRRAWFATASSPLTESLATAGVPVVRAPRSAFDYASDRIHSVFAPVDYELTHVSLVEQTDSDVALVSLLREIFDRAHRAPAGIVLANLVGAREDLIAVAMPNANARVLDRDDAVKNPFALFGRRTLALSVEHPHVEAAREAEDPIVGAAHLARSVLLQFGLLDADRSRAVLDLALDRIGVSK